MSLAAQRSGSSGGAGTAPHGRRTQGARSAAMRARLLDAAVECLVELGYSGTTTIVVCERAGVSRGAQLHHYPTRTALVAAAVEHVFAALTDEYRAGFAAIPAGIDRLGAALDLLWSMYISPHHGAVLELYVAARTDPELRALLVSVASRHSENVTRLASEYFPSRDNRERFEAILGLVLNAMLGLAVTRVVYGDEGVDARVFALLRDLAATVIDPSNEG